MSIAALVGNAAVGAALSESTPTCNQTPEAIYKQYSAAVVRITGQSINPYARMERVVRSLGSGFIVDQEGLVLTNSHVVFGLQALRVTMDDGSTLPAKLVGADPILDVAIVQVPKPTKSDLPILALGNSDLLRPGQDVLAIGNPLGLDQTITRGIISAVNRIFPETSLSLVEPMVQTDTPINPGNSGGPLLNLCGDVIGMTTSILSNAQNIGFAIPSNVIKSIAEKLIKDGRVIRPWIGFHGQFAGSELRKLLTLPLVEGLIIEAVEPGSPAEKAGIHGGELEFAVDGASILLGGDIVTAINDVRVSDIEKADKIIRGLTVGSTLKLRLVRDGEERSVEYELPERPLLPGDVPGPQQSGPGPGAVHRKRPSMRRF